MSQVITKREDGSRRVVRHVEGESKTEQHHRDEVNINKIIAKYEKTGQMPLRSGVPTYGDFTGMVDFHSAKQAVIDVEEAFMELPAEVRKRFRNDPGELLEFLDDEKNREEAIELGLVERVVEPMVEPEGPSEDASEPAETPPDGA